MTVWAVLKIYEDGDRVVHVHSSAQAAGEDAAEHLSSSDGDMDGYVPDLVNAATDGDSSEFVSNGGSYSVQIFRDEMEVIR